MIFCKGAATTKMQIERNGRDERETTAVEAMLKVPCAGELLGAAVGLVRAADSNSRTDEGTFALLIKAFSLLKQFAEAVCSADTVGETEAEMTQAELLKSKLPEAVEKIHAEKYRLVPDCSSCAAPCGRTEDYDVRRIIDAPPEIRTAKLCLVQSLLNTAVGRPFSDEKTIMCIARGIFMLGEDCTAEELNGSAREIENLRKASA